MTTSPRTIDCFYCGRSGPRSREHVLPKWLWTELLKSGDPIAPERGRHRFGGNKTLSDVCIPCNTGPLKLLDEAGREWFLRRGESRDPVLDASPPVLARWIAKLAVNHQHAESALSGWEPRAPESVKAWILGSPPANVAVCVAAMPSTHAFAYDSGFYGCGDRTLGVRSALLSGLLFFVAWHHQMDPVSRDLRTVLHHLRTHFALVQLDLTSGTGPIEVPLVANPDELSLGIYDDPEQREAFLRRYP